MISTPSFASRQPPRALPSDSFSSIQIPEAKSFSDRLQSIIKSFYGKEVIQYVILGVARGDGSSDEENLILDNVPDDEDEYDTEHSIDDYELEDYFKIDDSVIKFDGIFCTPWEVRTHVWANGQLLIPKGRKGAS